MINRDILQLLAKAANDLESGCWWEDKPISDKMQGAWLVGAVYSGNAGQDYAAYTAFGNWWAPAEYRNDGLRTNETANEKGHRLGRRATVAAIREFVAAHSESIAA